MTYLSVADSPEVMRAFFRSVAIIEVGVNGLILLDLLRLRNWSLIIACSWLEAAQRWTGAGADTLRFSGSEKKNCKYYAFSQIFAICLKKSMLKYLTACNIRFPEKFSLQFQIGLCICSFLLFSFQSFIMCFKFLRNGFYFV